MREAAGPSDFVTNVEFHFQSNLKLKFPLGSSFLYGKTICVIFIRVFDVPVIINLY